MKDLIQRDKSSSNTEQGDTKVGPIGRGKSAVMALLTMIEGSRERDAKTWIRLFETVCEFRYTEDTGLEQNELVVLDVILHSLLPKIPSHSRRKFADRLSRWHEASDILIESLIVDELTVAAPILARCPFITEEHLKAAISRGTERHRQVIAGRPELPVSVIEALLDVGDVKAMAVLLANRNLILNEKCFLRLLDRYLGDEKREWEVLQGAHLTMPLAYRSYWRWSPSSRAAILQRYPMTTESFGQVLDSFMRMRGEGNAAGQDLNASIALYDRLSSVRDEGYTLVLDQSNINQLVDFMINGLCIGKRSIKRILTDPSGLSLAVFFNALGLRASQFEEVYARLFQEELGFETYTQNLASVSQIFSEMGPEEAGNLISVWCFADVRPKAGNGQELAA